MKMISSLRGGLLLTSACAVLAACSGSGDVKNEGTTGPVTIGGGGGGTPTTADGMVDLTSVSCPENTAEDNVDLSSAVEAEVCVLSGTLLTDTTLVSGNAYALDGTVFVGENTISNPNGTTATLTIEPGVVLFGLNGEDALVISPGSDIIANGSPSQPIIMTSSQDLADADAVNDLTAVEAASDGVTGGSTTARGQWGGLVINGLAPINDCEDGNTNSDGDLIPGTVECVKDGEGGSGLFGGDDPNDDSGSLSYVRVQYAGFLFSTDDELNGIAFQGVGDGTDVDHIQVHNNADDGVEFFGGTVNASHIVITGAGDDSIDWTDGWQGDLQYAVVVQTDGDANRAMEGDNRGGDNGIEPQSMPNIANFTLVTNFDSAPDGADDGMKLREGTAGLFANGIVSGFVGEGFDYDGPADFSVEFPTALADIPSLQSIFIANSGAEADGNVDNGESEDIFNADPNNVETGSDTLDGLFAGVAEQGVTPADLSGVPGLDNVDYIGAFAYDVQSIATSWLAGWTLTTPFPETAPATCPAGTSARPTGDVADVSSGATYADLIDAAGVSNVCTLPAVVSNDLTLTNGNLYELDGTVFVGTDAGPDAANPFPASVQASLTIEPGVTLFGLNGEDALVVSRGSEIFSNGTAGAPVVMTSKQDLLGTATATSRGQWGGVVLNGRAPINDCEDGNTNGDGDLIPGTVECEKDGEGGSGLFGGNDASDSSGSITYTRVQYAGFLFSTDDELNGIAFQGVGNGTNISHIQIHNNADDGVEFFGGDVNAKYVVVTGAGDDSIDWTDGWTGNLQYAIVVQTDGDANRAIEGDNRGGDGAIIPQSNPWISNFTFVTNFTEVPDGADDGIKMREGTSGRVMNGVVVGYVGEGFDFDAPADFSVEYPTEDPSTRPVILSTYLAANGASADGNVDDGDSEAIFAADPNNTEEASGSLVADSDGTGVALLPNAAAQAVTAADTDRGEGFFDDVDYIGAIKDDSDNWYVGWTFSL